MLCLPPWHSTANRQIVAKSPRSYKQTALAPFRKPERADTGFAGSTPSDHCRHSPCEVCPIRGARHVRIPGRCSPAPTETTTVGRKFVATHPVPKPGVYVNGIKGYT